MVTENDVLAGFLVGGEVTTSESMSRPVGRPPQGAGNQTPRPCPSEHMRETSDAGRMISRVWIGKHCAAIGFHSKRGMSRRMLNQIYGRATVDAVLGPHTGGLSEVRLW